MKTVKCVVWDLDNTLWNGTLLEGDDVQVTAEARHLLELLDSRGILQAVASKNDHDHAWAKLEQLGVADYFVAARIGWSVKSESVRQIAEELRFAESTIAFIDDQPAERAEVEYHRPDVRCYDAARIPELGALPDLTPPVVTADSRNRRGMYRAAARRDSAREEHTGPDADFVRSLDLVMRIEHATEEHLLRVEELTLRTSQMNATGVHYSLEALRALLDDPAHRVLVVSMADRFGPHGAVGVVLMEVGGPAWHLKLLATSCRVVAFGAGAVLLRWLDDQAARAGAHILADFRRTERNRMMEIAYRFSGFTDDDCACRAALGFAGDGLQRLHLVTAEQPPPDTMTLEAPEPAGTAR
ncbi:HAD-IIIC family phosphatase [Cryptosporangium arvum]|uniref:Subfamily IIIC HAD-superfamily phosphatase n=1 Tax=Cryptosporangium arvum DSM 44712 TaxID=927661 RepID=A0A011AJD7_9ACTN|nr:HAD-IIIC family phosphatase [Cryptosporangium arvum]EXG82131.1 subfamily IIIC HAD-superfamily phosphatase [Cryptosporangium arvum DSM 44712]